MGGQRLPERGILDILTRTAYAIGWHRHFGPASGSDPKIRDTLGRYALLTFCQGANLGPAQVAHAGLDMMAATAPARRQGRLRPAPGGSMAGDRGA